jgi:hypothetical protein
LCGSNTFTNKVTSFSSTYTGSVTGSLLDPSYYNVVDNNIMTIDLSTLSGSGTFNVVINNTAGWVSTYAINNCTFTRP